MRGLFYFGKRFYDPEIGRGICPDPKQEFHDLYRYTTNPINFIDLLGLAEIHMALFMVEYSSGQKSAAKLQSHFNSRLSGTGDKIVVKVFKSSKGLGAFLKSGDKSGIAAHHAANKSYITDNAGNKIELSDLNQDVANLEGKKVKVSACGADKTLSKEGGVDPYPFLEAASGLSEPVDGNKKNTENNNTNTDNNNANETNTENETQQETLKGEDQIEETLAKDLGVPPIEPVKENEKKE